MSGFARGLAARARSDRGAVVPHARREPRFVPGTGACGEDAPGGRGLRGAIAGAAAELARAADAPASRGAGAAALRDDRHAPSPAPHRVDVRDREPEAAGAPAAPAPPAPVPAAEERRRRPSPRHARMPESRSAAPPPAVPGDVRDAAAALVAPASRETAPPPAPVRAPVRATAARATPVRTAPRLPAALPATGGATAAGPRIEVHVGRVEVSAPPPAPTRPARAVRAPQRQHGAAAPPAGSAFGELAAARRHVDRIAR
jgi:hypothetical protein